MNPYCISGIVVGMGIGTDTYKKALSSSENIRKWNHKHTGLLIQGSYSHVAAWLFMQPVCKFPFLFLNISHQNQTGSMSFHLDKFSQECRSRSFFLT